MIADGPLPLPGSFLRRNPAGETEPRNGRGLVAVMAGPFEDRGRSLVKSVSDGSSLAVLAAPECDMDLAAYEMTMLVEAVGDIITPATRA